MSEERKEKSALVPRRRFHGFPDAWVSSPMSNLYSFKGNNSLSRDKLNYEGGSLRNIHYGDIHTKFSLHFRVDAERVPYINSGESSSAIRPENYCMAGDMVFADASEDMADIGKAIEIIDAGDIPLVSGLHTILARPNEGYFALGFGAYLFSSEGVRKQIQREAQGAKVLGLSATRLGNVQLHYPGKPDEQQKIADCLSSLNDLITAETQKLDALKTHKKGLMQQLFPREGKTVPQRRFPEFRDAPPWRAKALNQISPSIFDGTHQTPTYTEEGVPFFSVENIVSGNRNKFISEEDHIAATRKNKPEQGDILITRIGIIGYSAVVHWENEFSIYVTLAVVKSSPSFDSYFLHGYFQSSRYQKEILSKALLNAVPCKINMEELRKTEVLLPEIDEQQQIADCLSSLDDLIAAQSQKIDALKSHKKGLMQQLFPVVDER